MARFLEQTQAYSKEVPSPCKCQGVGQTFRRTARSSLANMELVSQMHTSYLRVEIIIAGSSHKTFSGVNQSLELESLSTQI